MAIKDLRKAKISEKVDVKEIQKQAFIEAYETILAENVVMTEAELSKAIREAKEEIIEDIQNRIKRAFGSKAKLIEKAILNGKTDLYIVTERELEEAESKMVEKLDEKIKARIGEANFENLESAIVEGKEVYILTDKDIKEVEEKFVEEMDKIIEDAIGKENFNILEKAIKNNEEIFVISEDLVPAIEEKMKAKIKEELVEADMYSNKNTNIIENFNEDYSSTVTLAEKLIDEGVKKIEESKEDEGILAGRLL